jgi:hypothetical protein
MSELFSTICFCKFGRVHGCGYRRFRWGTFGVLLLQRMSDLFLGSDGWVSRFFLTQILHILGFVFTRLFGDTVSLNWVLLFAGLRETQFVGEFCLARDVIFRHTGGSIASILSQPR